MNYLKFVPKHGIIPRIVKTDVISIPNIFGDWLLIENRILMIFVNYKRMWCEIGSDSILRMYSDNTKSVLKKTVNLNKINVKDCNDVDDYGFELSDMGTLLVKARTTNVGETHKWIIAIRQKMTCG